jgi:Ca2+-binding RTX toxin-like protein
MNLEKLEARRHLSASITSEGALLIVGTAKNDKVIVSSDGVGCIVRMGRNIERFNSIPSFISVQSHGGDDYVELDDRLEYLASSVGGGSGDDTLIGGGANDRLDGSDGDDILDGRRGDDQLNGARGRDSLIGGEGFDTNVSYGERSVGVFVSNSGLPESGEPGELDVIAPDVEGLGGTNYDDAMVVSPQSTQLVELGGGDGNDVLISDSSFSVRFFGGNGNDTITGGIGDDTTDGGAGSDSLSGGDGIDALVYGFHLQPLLIDLRGTTDGGEVDEHDVIAADFETAAGSFGNDTIYGNSGGNRLEGGPGNDLIRGLDGNDTLYGGEGNDRLYGNGGNDRIYGEQGNDRIFTNDSSLDLVRGGVGIDTLIGDALDSELSIETHK